MEKENKYVIVLMCNNVESYINCTIRTLKEIRENGKYNGDIVLMYDDDLKDKLHVLVELNDVITHYNIKLKYFPTVDRTKFLKLFKENPFKEGDKREVTKSFQFHKLYLFDTYFKQWEKVFYIDAGMHIFREINKILELDCKGTLLAHSDTYPYYKQKLDCQFEKTSYPDVYLNLKNTFNLNVDYFQTGVLLFDTSIIKANTFNDLIGLSEQFFISKTNEQGIMNLYFNCKLKIWKQIKTKDSQTRYYDMWERPGTTKKDFIMLKRIRFD